MKKRLIRKGVSLLFFFCFKLYLEKWKKIASFFSSFILFNFLNCIDGCWCKTSLNNTERAKRIVRWRRWKNNHRRWRWFCIAAAKKMAHCCAELSLPFHNTFQSNTYIPVVFTFLKTGEKKKNGKKKAIFPFFFPLFCCFYCFVFNFIFVEFIYTKNSFPKISCLLFYCWDHSSRILLSNKKKEKTNRRQYYQKWQQVFLLCICA